MKRNMRFICSANIGTPVWIARPQVLASCRTPDEEAGFSLDLLSCNTQTRHNPFAIEHRAD